MSELIVFAFKTETGAKEMGGEIKNLQKQQLITLEDAAIVVRKQDGKVKVKQANNLVGAGALGGAFWGMLIGLIFWMPWLGLAVGAITGAIAGKATDVGIDDKFIKDVGETIDPGDSALFLLVVEATADKVLDDLKKFNATVIRTSLSKEQEAKLKDAFAAEEIDTSETE
ncbi:MAG: DUF1269 domain-containing protein [Chloroflexota bacterium]|nr:DUF1269 domain-containing protein [Chloroflexota bacterium]